jgi:RimJ/RimL family protein N-acetyltransferase
MEEIQIDKAYHSTGIFSGFFSWLLHVLPHKEIEIVEAYAHKENVKSQGILQHLGLTPVGENKNGSCYRYRGEYRTLLRKYS